MKWSDTRENMRLVVYEGKALHCLAYGNQGLDTCCAADSGQQVTMILARWGFPPWTDLCLLNQTKSCVMLMPCVKYDRP